MNPELLEALNILGMFTVALAYLWVNHFASRGVNR